MLNIFSFKFIRRRYNISFQNPDSIDLELMKLNNYTPGVYVDIAVGNWLKV
jgi:hypothetical protein